MRYVLRLQSLRRLSQSSGIALDAAPQGCTRCSSSSFFSVYLVRSTSATSVCLQQSSSLPGTCFLPSFSLLQPPISNVKTLREVNSCSSCTVAVRRMYKLARRLARFEAFPCTNSAPIVCPRRAILCGTHAYSDTLPSTSTSTASSFFTALSFLKAYYLECV